MPYKTNADLPASVKNNLPEAAQSVYREAFNGALGGTCKGDEGCAAKIAWTAVENGWKKSDKGWVKKSNTIVGLSFYITKAVQDKKTGERRFSATCSNTKEDAFKTFMSLDLFKDFINRIHSGEQPPTEFRSDAWQGGMPYLSVSHYLDLGGMAKAGDTTDLFIDGDYLKAKGTFGDNPVGQKAFEAVVRDLAEKPEKPIRISIGFLDYGHKHGNIEWVRKGDYDTCPLCATELGPKVYTRGLLIHEALTRIPANVDTSIGLEERSMGDDIVTRKDDAESIVGEELATEMDEKSKLIGMSTAKPAAEVVIRTDKPAEEPAPEPDPEDESDEEEDVEEPELIEVVEEARKDVSPADKKAAEKEYGDVKYADAANKKYPIDTEEHIRAAWSYINMPKNAAKYSPEEVKAIKSKIVAAWKKVIDKAGPQAAAEKKSVAEDETPVEQAVVVADPLDTAYAELRSALGTIVADPALPTQDEKLRSLQAPFETFATVVKASVAVPEEEVVEDVKLSEGLTKADLLDALTPIVNAISAVQSDLQAVKLSQATPPTRESSVVPQRRSFQPPVNARPPTMLSKVDPTKPQKVMDIVRRNMGLPPK